MKLLTTLTLAFAAFTFGSAQIVTSFEAPTFTPGLLDTQDGWVDSAFAKPFSVVNTRAFDGLQSVKFSGSATAYAYKNVVTPLTGAVHSEVAIYLDSSGSTDRFFGLRLESSPIGLGFGLGASISPTGSIYVGSDAPFNVSPIGTLAGPITNRWIRITLDYTTGASTGTAVVDGQSFTVGNLNPIADVLTSDLYADFNSSQTSVGVGYFDKFALTKAVPEPSSFGLLGLVGVALLGCRRKVK